MGLPIKPQHIGREFRFYEADLISNVTDQYENINLNNMADTNCVIFSLFTRDR